MILNVLKVSNFYFLQMSNRTSGYYRKGRWVSPDGYGRKRGVGNNNGGDFNSYLIIGILLFVIWMINKCSN